MLIKEVNKLYSKECSCCNGFLILEYKQIYDIIDNIIKVAKKMFARDNPRGNKAYDLDHDVMTKEYNTLLRGIKEAIGADMSSNGVGISYSDTRHDTVQRLRINLVTFVAFKNYQQRAEMIKELVDEKNQIRSWNTYRSRVSKMGQEWNDNWLRAEYNTTVASTQSAVQWETFEKQKHIFPYLKYRTQNDSKVRDAHKKLEGVVKHIDDTFWDDKYPPNGWNCRCFVLQDRGPGDKENYALDEKDHPPVFRFNPGKQKEIFSKEHPYFTLISKSDKEKVLNAKNEFLHNKLFFDNIEGFETHVSNYKDIVTLNKHIKVAKLFTPILSEKPMLLPTFPMVKGKKAPDKKTSNHQIEFKGITSDKEGYSMLRPIKRNIVEATIQLTNSEYTSLQSVIIIELKNKLIFDKRVINSISKILIDDMKLYFIYQSKVTLFNDYLK